MLVTANSRRMKDKNTEKNSENLKNVEKKNMFQLAWTAK